MNLSLHKTNPRAVRAVVGLGVLLALAICKINNILLPSPINSMATATEPSVAVLSYAGRSTPGMGERFYSDRMADVSNQRSRREILPASALEQIRMEAEYVLSCQYSKYPSSPAYGAFNNVYGNPTWIVPGENAIAIMGLVAASDALGDPKYRNAAVAAADYLTKVQAADGAWYSKYSHTSPTDSSKALRHTAEVMLAFYKLGYDERRYSSMVRAAQFLLDCQNPRNKLGIDDGLVGGGRNASGEYETWRWASDNAFAYQALNAAARWSAIAGRHERSDMLVRAADRIRRGLADHMLAPTGDHWHRAINRNGNPVAIGFDWINYAPAMLDVPMPPAVHSAASNWIARTFQKTDGALVWDTEKFASRKSPGYCFQAMLVWMDGNKNLPRVTAAMDWASSSSLWLHTSDSNGVRGGWIDWTEGPRSAPWWQRFIDTSAYYIMVRTGGYDFSTSEPVRSSDKAEARLAGYDGDESAG